MNCRQLFQGLASNAKISSVELNLSGNSLGQNGATVLETVLPTTHNIHTLDISDNGYLFSYLPTRSLTSIISYMCIVLLHYFYLSIITIYCSVLYTVCHPDL